MFENILTKKMDVEFKKESNCYTFEISNFLSEEQYSKLEENYPSFNTHEAQKINKSFNDVNNANKSKIWISEMHEESYKKHILSRPILKEFVETLKNPLFTNFLLKKFYFKILKSRIFDPSNFAKILIRKNRTYKKRTNIYDKFLFNEIYTTVEWAYLFNGVESWPHTDGKKKNFKFVIIFSR